MIEKLKKDTNKVSDIIYKDIIINNQIIYIIYSEVLTSSTYINDIILKNISYIIETELLNTNNLFSYLYNNLPGHNRVTIKDYNDLLLKLWNGYTIIYINDNEVFALEARLPLDRGINTVQSELSIRGPKDSFTENFNKNFGLIRKRIKSKNLWLDDLIIGKETKTKVGIIYMKNIAEDSLVKDIKSKLEKINIDGIIDSGYLKKYLVEKNSVFPTIITTERPDLVSMALLEGKCAIIVDNSPYCLIVPCFLIDLFHAPDDYYQKAVNISFIRFIRLMAFLIAIFIPAYYIAITTHNHDSVATNLLLNFLSQRHSVPFPALVEGLIMTISFEILRESDMRMASTMGTAVSVLGGLVLGDAAVQAGIISPIMILVVAISAISGLAFTSIELTSAIRTWRIILMILAASLGIYGIFLGLILLVTKLSSITSFNKPYLAPFSPYINVEQRDALLKINNGKKIKRRNPLLTAKNRIRGR